MRLSVTLYTRLLIYTMKAYTYKRIDTLTHLLIYTLLYIRVSQ